MRFAMTKIECKYISKLEIINSLIDYIENSEDDIDIDLILKKLYRSRLFYRSQLVDLD